MPHEFSSLLGNIAPVLKTSNPDKTSFGAIDGETPVTALQPADNHWVPVAHISQELSQLHAPLAHAGLGVTVLGIVAVTTFQTEHVVEMTQGQSTEAGGYSILFDGMRPATGPNYTEDRGHFSIRRGGAEVADVWSAKRLYTARQMPTTEAGILTFGLSELYVSQLAERG